MDGETAIEQARTARTDAMATAIEAVALRRFRDQGFAEATVEAIARDAGISVRTFYRYFPTKEDVLQLRIERRTEALAAMLAARPADEPPMQAVRLALAAAVAVEDPDLIRLWTDVISATPSVTRGVIGGITMKTGPLLAGFLADRLGEPPDGLVPTILAAAIGGAIQAAQTRWYLEGGDLTVALSDALAVLDAHLAPTPT